MPNLTQFKAKICLTAAGLLLHEQRVLLVKHKKLGIWLAPGGHIEADELPHQAAEREFWEEAGIKVQAIDLLQPIADEGSTDERLPRPIVSDLHWVSRENYDARLKSKNPDQRVTTTLWPRGCEQHFGAVYLVKPVDSVQFTANTEESTGIGWFTLDQVQQLTETNDEIKAEVRLAFELVKK